MPSTVPAPLQVHLDGEVLTICHIWYIRRRDTVTYRFTSHDADVEFDGNVYYALNSEPRSAMEFRLNLAVNNLELRGFLDELRISETDLIAGRFERAEVRMSIINWAEPTQGQRKTIRGWLGQVTREGDAYVAEVRSLAQALQETIGSVISERCRSLFGATGIGADTGCAYPIAPEVWQADHLYGDQPHGNGATFTAVANGHGLWDGGGANLNHTVTIGSGGLGYSQNLQVVAYWSLNNVAVKWESTSYTVDGTTGEITDVFFPYTFEGAKPAAVDVKFSVLDLGGVSKTIISPPIANGFAYELIVSGTSGSVAPTFPTVVGATVADGTAVWKAIQGLSFDGLVQYVVTPRSQFGGRFHSGTFGDITGNTVVLGSGAKLVALPNGHGLWDGGSPTQNVQIAAGGANYVNPSVTALFINPVTQQPVEWEADVVGLSSTGSITWIVFPPTVEGEKPTAASVSFVIEDVPAVDTDSEAGFFDAGTVLFTSGANLGIEIDIKTFEDQGGGFWEVELYAPAPFNIEYGNSDGAGVTFKVGCDHRWQTCKNRFKNQLNFRGEPGIPGTDVLFRINTNL